MEDEERRLCDVGLCELCCVTDEVSVVRQELGLKKEERVCITVVRIFAVLGRVNVWS